MEKVPQPVQEMLGELGEKSVMAYLALKACENKKYEVFKNINEPGYDILLINKETGKKTKIEVKTRQRIYTTSEHNHFSFDITELEYMSCDVVICYWWEKNTYFIVPKENLTKTSSNEKPCYKFWIKPGADGKLKAEITPYINNWAFLGL